MNLSDLRFKVTSDSEPIGSRFRALFTLKSLNTIEAIEILSLGFQDESELLKHEVAYVLGQMKNPLAIPILSSVLADLNQQTMVRHEAAEALGAIGQVESIPVLEKFLKDKELAIQQTCELAIEKIKLEQHSQPILQNVKPNQIQYGSVDPAPAFIEDYSVPELQKILVNESVSLFTRYQAMFSLRNIGTDEAVLALATGFDDTSALFRHEIAYIFGQMQHPKSVEPLQKVLERDNEEAMVRHECAEALGSIATANCKQVLEKYAQDHEAVVRESCLVALDMYEYESSGNFTPL